MPRRSRWRSAGWAIAAALVAAGCADAPDRRTAVPADTGALLTLNSTELFVLREGAGEPAIVIHGGPVLDHGYIRPHLRPLTDRLELVYYDQRLSGRSAGIVDSASVRLDTFVADIEALRDALDLDRVHLIAHSWGGLLAMKYAIAHPDRVRSLILISPMAPTAALWREEEQALAASLTPDDTAGLGALRADPALAAHEPAAVQALLKHSFRSQLHDPALAATLDFHIADDYGQRSRQFGFMLPDLLGYDITEALRSVAAPSLILYGEHEPGLRLGGDALVRALPDARLVAVPAAGHFSFLENPGFVLDIVGDFLTDQRR